MEANGIPVAILPQGETLGGQAGKANVQPTVQGEQATAVAQPEAVVSSLRSDGGTTAVNIPNPVQNVPSEEVKGDIALADDGIALPTEPEGEEELILPGGEKGILAEIDAKNFRVMRGRDREKPDPKRVRRIKLAVKNKRPVRRVKVYRDKESRELFSPNGGHRQQAYDELGMKVSVVIFDVENAAERAELESCFANEDNGSGRSPADMRFQAGKATEILTKRLGRPPKPGELAKIIHASDKFANSFLHDWFSRDAGNAGDDDDAEPDSTVPAALLKILEGLKKIEPPADWKPGYVSKPILAGIGKEIGRIARHKCPEPAVTPDEIKAFLERHSLNAKELARRADVSPVTVGRWLKGTVTISESNTRTLRQIMSYSDEQARTLHDDATEEERDE